MTISYIYKAIHADVHNLILGSELFVLVELMPMLILQRVTKLAFSAEENTFIGADAMGV